MPAWRLIFGTLAAVCVLAGSSAVATSQTLSDTHAKLDRAVSVIADRVDDAKIHRVVVTAAPGTGSAVLAEARTLGYDVQPIGNNPDLLVLRGSREDILAFAAAQSVQRVSTDAVVRAEATGVTSPIQNNLLLETLGVSRSTSVGRRIGVAVIDSGIAPSSDFIGRPLFFNFTTVDARGDAMAPVPSVPYDDFGHGTHVAGLIANNGRASNGAYRGVAPGVRLIALKVLDATGAGLTSNVIRAIDFAIENKGRYGIDVLNLSLGHIIYEPAASDPLVQAVERAVAAGLVVVTSAGNIGQNPETGEVGYAGITSPGNAPSAITVGALDTRGTVSRYDDAVAPFSSRGPSWFDGFVKPDLVAPGTRLVSNAAKSATLTVENPTLLMTTSTTTTLKTTQDAQTYIRFSGTSMSAAVTTGVVALMIQAQQTAWPTSPTLTANTVKAILQVTAITVPDADVLSQGAGGLNGRGAIDLAAAVNTTAAPGTQWLKTNVLAGSSTLGGTAYSWSGQIVWGDRVVWGNLLQTADVAWSQRVVWGNQVVWGDRVVWGNSLVWEDPATWATRVVWGNALIGVDLGDTTSGERIVWGDRIVWGNRVVWDNLNEDMLGATSVY